MAKLNGVVVLKQTGKRMDDRDLEAPLRVSITTPSGDVFQWVVPQITLQPADGSIHIPLPPMEAMR